MDVYYFPQKGYYPAVRAGKEKCTMIATDDLLKAKKGIWLRPNPLGGNCGYTVTIGVNEDIQISGFVNITMEFENEQSKLNRSNKMKTAVLISLMMFIGINQ